jgi:hypothetical protein
MSIVIRLLAAVAMVATLVWAWTRLPRSAFYGPGGPTRLGRATNRVMVWWSGSGLPPARQAALELRGRKSGIVRTLPVVVATVGGERYLVSMLGEKVSWVANARASGTATLRKRRRERVRMVEVFGPERVPVLREYLRLAPGARPFFDVSPDAPDSALAEIADRYPVFRLDPQGS